MQTIDLNKNYFQVFEIPVAYTVDSTQLRERHQQLQSEFHPDRFAHSNDQQKRLATQQAAWINEAYMTLNDSVKRARYLLELSGVELNDESQTTSDTEFLMEQMSIREALDNCRTSSDPLAKCDQIESQLKQRADQLNAEFIDSMQSEQLTAALQVSRKMQFISRIQQQLRELQFELEDSLE